LSIEYYSSDVLKPSGINLMNKIYKTTTVITATLLFISFFSFIGLGMVSQGAMSPTLGTAASYAILAGSTVTNTGASRITGNLGVSTGSSCTGFQSPCLTPHTGLVIGTINLANAAALQAKKDLVTAYNALTSQTCNKALTGMNLGGQTLVANVYCFTSSAQLTGTLTLNAQGNSNAVWIFQIASTLTTASASSVVMTNGGNPCNVFWQIGASATLGTTTKFKGNILALTSITVTTGTNIIGRTLARNGGVTLDNNHISFSTCGTTVTSTTVKSTTITSTITTTITSPSTTTITTTSTIPTSTTLTTTFTTRTTHTTSCGGGDVVCTTSRTSTTSKTITD
jgi:Ice-binding-like